jgi:hypothetical protein
MIRRLRAQGDSRMPRSRRGSHCWLGDRLRAATTDGFYVDASRQSHGGPSQDHRRGPQESSSGSNLFPRPQPDRTIHVVFLTHPGRPAAIVLTRLSGCDQAVQGFAVGAWGRIRSSSRSRSRADGRMAVYPHGRASSRPPTRQLAAPCPGGASHPLRHFFIVCDALAVVMRRTRFRRQIYLLGAAWRRAAFQADHTPDDRRFRDRIALHRDQGLIVRQREHVVI